MFKIVRKKQLNDQVVLFEIEAPFIAKKAQAGQFIIFRLDEYGERVPLTISDFDREKGTITIVFQTVGASTIALGRLDEGEEGPSVRTEEGQGDGLRRRAFCRDVRFRLIFAGECGFRLCRCLIVGFCGRPCVPLPAAGKKEEGEQKQGCGFDEELLSVHEKIL